METTTRSGQHQDAGRKTDLLIGVSIETGIMTSTMVKGKGGGGGSAQASGEIRVTLEIDGGAIDVYPPDVTFDARTQTTERGARRRDRGVHVHPIVDGRHAPSTCRKTAR